MPRAYDNLMQKMVGRLRDTVVRFQGVNIRYHSNVTGDTYEVRASSRETRGERDENEGFGQLYSVRVFVIDIYGANSIPVVPLAGDRIEWLLDCGNRIEHYTVVEDSGDRETQTLGNQGAGWKVHTILSPPGPTRRAAHGNAAGEAYGNQDGIAYGSSPAR